MTRQLLAKILFVTALAAGIALSIASIAVPPLLIPGITLIAGALGLFQGSLNRCDSETAIPHGTEEVHEPSDAPQEVVRNSIDSHDVTSVQNNMFFMYGRTPSNRGDDVRLPQECAVPTLTMV